MAGRTAEWLRPSPGERMMDLGSGTGLFLREMVKSAAPDTPILCVDPFQSMLDQVPDDPRYRTICASAEDVAEGKVPLPYDKLDVIACKETIHHVRDIAGTLASLARMMNPGGRILLVSLVPRLEYPIFQAALDRFEENQPNPEGMRRDMEAAGLRAELAYEEWPVTVDRDEYIELVRRQWMSVLSTFSKEEIEEGVKEIRQRYSAGSISFKDRFAFVYGVKP
ncbi:MAG: methyltransferase domain-containing protein [Streptosporangiales bacterium]|nr:methyltransferase domain-containing protein [Streptosporangiales bacterium]